MEAQGHLCQVACHKRKLIPGDYSQAVTNRNSHLSPSVPLSHTTHTACFMRHHPKDQGFIPLKTNKYISRDKRDRKMTGWIHMKVLLLKWIGHRLFGLLALLHFHNNLATGSVRNLTSASIQAVQFCNFHLTVYTIQRIIYQKNKKIHVRGIFQSRITRRGVRNLSL